MDLAAELRTPIVLSFGGPERHQVSFLYLRSSVTVEGDRAVLSEITQIVNSAVRVLLTWTSEHDVGSCQIHGT